jgi:hypothetical protein
MAKAQLSELSIERKAVRRAAWGAALALLLGCSSRDGIVPGSPATLQLAVFASDVTPPLGHPLCGGWIAPASLITQPLVLKGVVLDDGKTRYVVAAMDWCLLRGDAFDEFRAKIARAAGIPARQVALQTTHTHSAPIVDSGAEKLIAATEKPPAHVDLEWLGRVSDEAGSAVASALFHLQPFTHVGVGQAKVEQFASTRRVVGSDGKVQVRFSSTKDPALRAAPEGRIDPWLKTVTFFDGETPLLRLHYYASHPQSHYGSGEVHPDTPGMARSYLEGEEGVAQLYFTGCAGDVTAGKYNDGTPAARVGLSKQLYSGMIRSIATTRRHPVTELSWKTVDVAFAPRREPQFSEAALRQTMSDPSATASKRLHAALGLAWARRVTARPSVELSRLRIGPADILHLPGEPFLEYQLHAQAARPDRFVAVAGYGDGGPGYICTDAAIAEGGYEPSFSFVGPPSESRLKAGIEELLR